MADDICRYCGEFDNSAAVMLVARDMECKFHVRNTVVESVHDWLPGAAANQRHAHQGAPEAVPEAGEQGSVIAN